MEQPPPYNGLEQTPSQSPGYEPPPNTGSQQTPGPYPPEPQTGNLPQQGYPQQPRYPLEKQHGGSSYPPQNPGYVQQPTGFASHTSNNTTVVVQQRPQVVAGVVPVLNDQMGLSIFACLCCFWPIGIFAIMKSSEARNRYFAGDYAGGMASARSARNLAYAAIICGLIIIPLIIVLRVAVFAASSSNN